MEMPFKVFLFRDHDENVFHLWNYNLNFFNLKERTQANLMKGWNLQMYHGQCSQRLLSKKSKLVVLFFFTRLTHPDHQLPLHSGQVVLSVVATLRSESWLWFWYFSEFDLAMVMVIVLFPHQVAPKWLGPLVLVEYYRHHISTQGNWNGWGRYRLSIKLSWMSKVTLPASSFFKIWVKLQRNLLGQF